MGTKPKRAIFMIGVTAAVYTGIRYLLPLILPFFISYGLARLIWPFVRWTGQKLHVPETAAILLGLAGIMLFIVAAAGGLGWLAWRQISELVRKLPEYISYGESLLMSAFEVLGDKFGRGENTGERMQLQIQKLGAQLRDEMLPQIAAFLVPTAARIGNLFAGIMIAAVSSVFFIRERSAVREWMEKSVYRREIRVITKRLGSLGRAFFKTQGIIFVLVALICTIGLRLIGNRYFLLLGAGLAILDMLPVFGTGSVLLPWTLIVMFMGKWGQAGGLALIYLLTYYLREFLEAHMMGKQLGITSLEMMISMYAGLKLFGLWGLFLGPVGWILIKEIDKTLYIG